MKPGKLLSVGGAAATGVAHGVLLSFLLAYLSARFPVAALVHSLGLGVAASNAILFPVDLTLHVVLSIPAVAILRLLGARHYARHVLVALVAFLIWVHFPAASLPGHTPLSWYTAWNLVVQVGALPVAAWLIGRGRVPPGNPFERTPLRGRRPGQPDGAMP